MSVDKGRISVLLPTVAIRLENCGKLVGPIRALLDSGAQPNLIPEKIVQAHKIPVKQLSRKIVGIEGKGMQLRKQVRIRITPWFESNFFIEEDFWVLPKDIDWSLVTPQASVLIKEMVRQPLADPAYWKSEQVDMILGISVFAKMMVNAISRCISTVAMIETAFGTVVFGTSSEIEHDQVEEVPALKCAELDKLDELVRQMWQMDQIETCKVRTAEEKAVEENFTRTARRDNDGRFVVTIPIRDSVKSIGCSKAIALRRFLYLERKLAREPALKDQYVEFMREYEKLGHMKRVDRSVGESGMIYYIPHHCVTKKFKVVFDCSCRTEEGISLNEVQQLGEKLQRDLSEIVMRFRRHRIAFSADIKMMFRQVRIAQHQWDLQRIFWRESPRDELQEYWLTVVTYGMTSSAHNAVRSLIQCARDASAMFPEVERVILNDFYMDDCVSGCDSEKEAITLARDLDKVLKTDGFELRKWKSNSHWLASQLDSERDRLMVFDKSEQATVLGLQWLVDEDQFTFVVKTPEVIGKVTKRRLLSCMAQLYDPNGYIAPVVILGKILIQYIWRTGMAWDDEIPKEIEEKWRILWKGIKALEMFRIDRWIGTSRGSRMQVHGFSDASTTAYGAVIYLRVEHPSGRVTSKLIVSKTRVAPLKTITIPRLELAAAELLGRLLIELCKAMDWERTNYILWTDSMVVLHWLRKIPRDMKTYVGNRVSSIQTNTEVKAWRHVGTKENPADLLSRGLYPEELVNSKLWQQGPSWLALSENEWPVNHIGKEAPPAVSSEMNVRLALVVTKGLGIWSAKEQVTIPVEEYAGKLERAINILAYVRRFIERVRHEVKENRTRKRRGSMRRKANILARTPTVSERAKAMKYLIQRAQQGAYGKDMAHLRKDGQLTEQSKIESLKPVFDDEDILRVGGRLHHAEGCYEAKHPAIIPQGSRLAWLLIDHAHRTTKHGASQVMMQYLRQRYWIPKLRSELRSYIHKCTVCVRYNFRLEQQLMAELPADRVRAGKPFLHTGVDYAGPFNIKILDKYGRRLSFSKAWVAVFICLKTRATHLEVIRDLTTVSFLASYARFISRRGYCQRMYSDNGTSFVGAARIIRQALRQWQEDDLFSQMSIKGTEWTFMVPAAPHQGGIYEAAVKSMKYHLKRIVGQRMLGYEQFVTLLVEIEGILNSRPIHPLSDDPTDMQALTPGHFLIGEAINMPLPLSLVEEGNSRGVKLFRERKEIVEHFWRRWREEYLVTLQERKKWRREREPVKVGQLVIIKSENFPPAQWLMGRIKELIKSKDGIVRSVILQTETGQLKRPVQKLCILPVEQ